MNMPHMVEDAVAIEYVERVKIEKGKRIRIHVRLAIVDGDELEKSTVEYFQGRGPMLKGLQKELEGLTAGAKKSGVIKAEHAFGDPEMQVTKKLTKKDFPKELKLEKGAQFMAKGADNQQDIVIRVVKVDGDDVEAQLMHPLADKDIEYDVEVLSVTDPMPPPMPAEALLEVAAEDGADANDDDK